MALICGASEALDDSQSGDIKQKRFQMFFLSCTVKYLREGCSK